MRYSASLHSDSDPDESVKAERVVLNADAFDVTLCLLHSRCRQIIRITNPIAVRRQTEKLAYACCLHTERLSRLTVNSL